MHFLIIIYKYLHDRVRSINRYMTIFLKQVYEKMKEIRIFLHINDSNVSFKRCILPIDSQHPILNIKFFHRI